MFDSEKFVVRDQVNTLFFKEKFKELNLFIRK